MRPLILPLLIATVTAFAPAAPAAPQAARAQAPLVGELARVIAEAGWNPELWGVLVVSLDGGDTLFAHRADEPMLPASNLKLFTTAAALHYLGPDYRMATYVTATGPIRDGVLHGDLLLYGTGDPTASGRFHESRTAVWEAIADSLTALGVHRIAGNVIGDGSYFEGPGFGAGWQTTYITHTYAAPAAALSFNDNVVTVRVRPGPEAGAPARIDLVPGGSVELVNRALTVASGRTQVEVQRAEYPAPLEVTGQVARGDPGGVWRAVPVRDPASYTASVVREILVARGIAVTGTVGAVSDPDTSPVTGRRVFAPALEGEPLVQVLAVHRSPPLQEILAVVNQRSHNLYADNVLRTVGRVVNGSGSAAGGEAAVRALLERAGVPGEDLRMDDGSGLSMLDRSSAATIVHMLTYMANESPFAAHYFETLPEAATSRGLRRMQETPAAGNLRAKTGTIERVSALSGYVTATNGERLAFAILSNNVPSTWRAKRIEDRIGARLAGFARPLAGAAELAVAGRGPEQQGGEVDAARAEAEGGELAEVGDVDPSGPATYTIQPGDTLEAIARRLGTTVAALREANPGVNPRRLLPGRSLNLPSG